MKLKLNVKMKRKNKNFGRNNELNRTEEEEEVYSR
jgi:hypothetical protein